MATPTVGPIEKTRVQTPGARHQTPGNRKQAPSTDRQAQGGRCCHCRRSLDRGQTMRFECVCVCAATFVRDTCVGALLGHTIIVLDCVFVCRHCADLLCPRACSPCDRRCGCNVLQCIWAHIYLLLLWWWIFSMQAVTHIWKRAKHRVNHDRG